MTGIQSEATVDSDDSEDISKLFRHNGLENVGMQLSLFASIYA